MKLAWKEINQVPNFLINLIHQSIAICTKRTVHSATQFIASWNDSVTQLANSHVGDAILQNKIPGNQQNILGQFIRTASLVIQIIPSCLQDHFLGLQRFNPGCAVPHNKNTCTTFSCCHYKFCGVKCRQH